MYSVEDLAGDKLKANRKLDCPVAIDALGAGDNCIAIAFLNVFQLPSLLSSAGWGTNPGLRRTAGAS